ncbi:LemA family protein [Cumulibacter manganitolerans]|uniref:hypothetical protein n=1 Tax=Cumulibacter manganitolerans TaxID=1884992 RepID=UPI001297C912|nr:hypothetical protein [Cumulibacter manganitolerans]
MLWLILALVALVLLTAWVTWTAMRIERLGARCEAAWQSLDAQLVRRASALREVTHDQMPIASGVHPVVTAALDARRDERARAENEISALIAALPAEHVDERLAEACSGVQVARTFYNDAVRAANALRAQRLPRLLGLGRATPVPPYFDIDDAPGTGRR